MNAASRARPDSCVTLGGVPLRFVLEWPFHKSSSGADWHVLHGAAYLVSQPELRADFSANFTETMVAALPSLEPAHAEPVVMNGVRMATDAGKLEFLKSGKRLPVEVSSRYLNFKTNEVQFLRATDAQMQDFIKKKLYWLGLRSPNPAGRVWIGDPYDAQYLGAGKEQLIAAANTLAGEGLCVIEGEFACASGALEEHTPYFQSEL